VNTTHGYWAGNIVLKQITRTLKQRLRRGDLLGRLYGDGFIIALHDADYASAEQVLAHLVKDLANLDCNVGNVSVKVTLSAGIAHYPGHIEVDKDPCFDILKTAEEAVRSAKKQGNGKVVIRSLSAAF
jgi:diguanylate cyclase (GGDEF)-like protein